MDGTFDKATELQIDDILLDLQAKKAKSGKGLLSSGSHSGELDDILSELGMSQTKARKSENFIRASQLPSLTPEQKSQEFPALHEAELRGESPLKAPFSQKHTSTVELDDTKHFVGVQEKRKHEIESAAARAAIEKVIATGQIPKSFYDVPGASGKEVGNNLFGEVDERFVAFFSKSAALDSPEAEKAYGGAKKGGILRRFFSTATHDLDEEFLTGEFEAQMRRPDKVPVRITTSEAPLASAQDTKQVTLQPVAPQKLGVQKSFTISMPLSGNTTAEAPMSQRAFQLMKNKRSANTAVLPETLAGHEYNALSDAPAVTASLANMRTTRLLRLCVTGAITLLLLYFGLSSRSEAVPTIAMFHPLTAPLAYLLVHFVLLVAAALTCLTTMGVGLVGLVRRPTADTLPALAVCGALLQIVVWLFGAKYFDAAATTLFAPIATFLLFTNTLGKWLQSKLVSDNFILASGSFEHNAAFFVRHRDLARKVCAGMGETEPRLLVSRPAGLVKGFLRQSFSAHASDAVIQKLAYALCGGAVLCGILCGVRGDGFLAAVTGLVATLCIGAPLTSSLVYAVPAFFLQKEAAAIGAVIPGPSAVEALGETNVVLLNGKDLFPASSVRLHGIKTFERERIDLAILYATSLLSSQCDTLRDTFMTLVDNKKELLYEVVNPTTDPGYGFTGWIDNQRVVVGNRQMMMRRDIEIPSLEYERKYTKDGERSPIYLAVAGKAFGMFLVSYLPDPSAQRVLDDLGESGISVLLQTEDFNITAALVSATYALRKTTLKVLSQPEREMLRTQTEFVPTSEGIMTHASDCKSFVGGLRAAAHAAANEKLALIVQMASIGFGMLFCLVMAFSLGLGSINLGAVLLYQFAWAVLTLVLPIIRKT